MKSLSVKCLSVLAALMPALAMAEGAPVGQPEGPSAIMQLVFFGGFILIFYFLMWRPQSKRAKEHRDLVSGLAKGDEVVVSGGIMGKILRVKDDFVALEIADGVEIKVQKASVTAALPKGTLKDI